MQFKSILAVLATGLAMVVAQEEVDSTITSTQTMTKTVTVTECNPTATNCPGSTSTTTETTTSWASFPVSNSTSSEGPTGTGSFIIPTPSVAPSQPSGSSSGGVVPSQTTGTIPIATGGAAGLFIQPAMLLGVLGAGVALLA